MKQKKEMKRNIKILKTTAALSGGLNFLPLILAFLIAEKLKIPKENIFFIEIGYLLSVVIFEVPTGIIADKLGTKKSLIIGDIFIAIAFLYLIIHQSFMGLIITRFIHGFGISFISGAQSAFLANSIDKINDNAPRKQHKTLAQYRTIIDNYKRVADIISISFLGLIATKHYELTVIVSAAMFVMRAVLLSLLGTDPMTNKLQKKKFQYKKIFTIPKKVHFTAFKEHFKTSLQQYKSNTIIMVLTSIFIVLLVSHRITIYSSEMLWTQAHIDISLFGYILSGCYIGQMAGNFIAPHTLNIKLPVLVLSILGIYGLIYILMGTNTTQFQAIILPAVLFCLMTILRIYILEIINNIIAPEIRATVLSIQSLLLRGVQLIVMFLFALSVKTISLNISFIILGLSILIISIMMTYKLVTRIHYKNMRAIKTSLS